MPQLTSESSKFSSFLKLTALGSNFPVAQIPIDVSGILGNFLSKQSAVLCPGAPTFRLLQQLRFKNPQLAVGRSAPEQNFRVFNI